MFDLILAQLGIKPDELKTVMNTVAANIQSAHDYAKSSDERLARIEKHLGIDVPKLEAPDDGGK